MDTICIEAYTAACQLLKEAKLQPGDLFVVGCSTSEVLGSRIGTHSAPEVASALFDGIYRAAREFGVSLAAQC